MLLTATALLGTTLLAVLNLTYQQAANVVEVANDIYAELKNDGHAQDVARTRKIGTNGPNGSGKTSLLNAILRCFYEMKKRDNPGWFTDCMRNAPPEGLRLQDHQEEKEGISESDRQAIPLLGEDDFQEKPYRGDALKYDQLKHFLLVEGDMLHTSQAPLTLTFSLRLYLRIIFHTPTTALDKFNGNKDTYKGLTEEVRENLGRVLTLYVDGPTFEEQLKQLRQLIFRYTTCDRCEVKGTYNSGYPHLWAVRAFEVGLPFDQLEKVNYVDLKGVAPNQRGWYTLENDALCEQDGILMVLRECREQADSLVAACLRQPGLLGRILEALRTFHTASCPSGSSNADDGVQAVSMRPQMLIVILAERAFEDIVKDLKCAACRLADACRYEDVHYLNRTTEEMEDLLYRHGEEARQYVEVESQVAARKDRARQHFEALLEEELMELSENAIPKEVVMAFVRQFLTVAFVYNRRAFCEDGWPVAEELFDEAQFDDLLNFHEEVANMDKTSTSTKVPFKGAKARLERTADWSRIYWQAGPSWADHFSIMGPQVKSVCGRVKEQIADLMRSEGEELVTALGAHAKERLESCLEGASIDSLFLLVEKFIHAGKMDADALDKLLRKSWTSFGRKRDGNYSLHQALFPSLFDQPNIGKAPQEAVDQVQQFQDLLRKLFLQLDPRGPELKGALMDHAGSLELATWLYEGLVQRLDHVLRPGSGLHEATEAVYSLHELVDLEAVLQKSLRPFLEWEFQKAYEEAGTEDGGRVNTRKRQEDGDYEEEERRQTRSKTRKGTESHAQQQQKQAGPSEQQQSRATPQQQRVPRTEKAPAEPPFKYEKVEVAEILSSLRYPRAPDLLSALRIAETQVRCRKKERGKNKEQVEDIRCRQRVFSTFLKTVYYHEKMFEQPGLFEQVRLKLKQHDIPTYNLCGRDKEKIEKKIEYERELEEKGRQADARFALWSAENQARKLD